LKLHYNTDINIRKDIAKKFAETIKTTAIFCRKSNTWQVGDVLFEAGGIIEGPLSCQQVIDLGYLLRDWEFADAESKAEYHAQSEYEVLNTETELINADYAIPDEPVVTTESFLIVPRNGELTAEQYDTPAEADAAGDAFYAHRDEPEVDQYTFTVKYTVVGWESETYTQLNNLIKSHEQLIKKALGTGFLEYRKEPAEGHTGDTLIFPWFPITDNQDALMAYSSFIASLCQKVQNLRKVDPTETPVEDEKFDFSRFLHRIGMVGSAYKKQRKLLMQNLDGSTWRKGVEERASRRAAVEVAV
jgi:hypothetical protein